MPKAKKAARQLKVVRDERSEIIRQMGCYIKYRESVDGTEGLVTVKGEVYCSLRHAVDFIYADRHKEL